MADLDCHVLRVAMPSSDATFLFHDCAAARGTSGAPLLTKREGGWTVIAVNIAASRAGNLALSARFGD